MDYAYLADYAKVHPDGLLTAVGASYTLVMTSQLPIAHRVFVAGRVRMEAAAERRVSMSVQVAGPEENSPEIRVDFDVNGAHAKPYDDRVGAMFVVETLYPIVSPGLHTVTVCIEEQCVRTLAFTVELVEEEEADTGGVDDASDT